MKAGRVEAYLHSDSYTENKGGCVILVTTNSDAAANTQEFKDFCKKIAPYCYAQGEVGDVLETFPEVKEWKIELEAKLKERICIECIYVLKV